MKGLAVLFGPEKRVFAGKQRLHAEPFCPFLTNETGYQALLQDRKVPRGLNQLSNVASFGPHQHAPADRRKSF